MSKKEDGGLAFPLHYEVFEKSEMMVHHEGMSLRDYFAIRCPESIIKKPNWNHIKKFKNLHSDTDIFQWKPEYSLEYNAYYRYLFADAMIKERSK